MSEGLVMERREWWTDDLIEAVSCLVSVDIGDDCLPACDVYEVIAAVEDWVLSALIFDLYLSRKHAPDKAAIARVRGMAEAAIAAHDELEGTYATVSAKALLRSLDDPRSGCVA